MDQEERSFSWTEHRNSFHDDIYKSVVEETKSLGVGSIETITLSDVLDKIFGGTINPYPDGQREIVFTPIWASSLISTLYETSAPLDIITVNSFKGVWFIVKGKQRLSTLFLFFIGLIHVTIKGEKYIWTRTEDPPTGSRFLFSNNRNSDRVLSTWRSDILKRLEEFDYTVEDEKENCMVMPENMREHFLNRVVHFHVLPEWPSKSTALYTVWTEMKSFKQSPSECVYSIPNLQILKKNENHFIKRAISFGLKNDKYQILTHVIRAILYKLGVKYLPFANNTREYDVIIGELNNFFVLKRFENNGVVESILTAVKLIEDLRVHIEDPSVKSKKLKNICPDIFTCFIVIASKGSSSNRDSITNKLNRAMKAFRGKVKEKKEALGANKLQLWNEGHKFGNFVTILKILE
jgi:hypothetical protein